MLHFPKIHSKDSPECSESSCRWVDSRVVMIVDTTKCQKQIALASRAKQKKKGLQSLLFALSLQEQTEPIQLLLFNSTMSHYQRIGRQVLLQSRGGGGVSKLVAAQARRHLSSSQLPSVSWDKMSHPSWDKMMTIFEDYRKNNWPEELPSRVLKEILTATDEDKDNKISMTELEHFLEHIGASDKMTRAELADFMTELGAEDNKVEIRLIKEKFQDKRGMH